MERKQVSKDQRVVLEVKHVGESVNVGFAELVIQSKRVGVRIRSLQFEFHSDGEIVRFLNTCADIFEVSHGDRPGKHVLFNGGNQTWKPYREE